MEKKKPPTIIPSKEANEKRLAEDVEEVPVEQVTFPGMPKTRENIHVSFPTPVPDSSEKFQTKIGGKQLIFPDWVRFDLDPEEEDDNGEK